MRKWIALGILGAVTLAVTYGDGLGIGTRYLADIAEFGSQFSPGDDAWFDAAMYLATWLMLIPFAGIALVLIGIPSVLIALESTVFPVSRRIGISDGIATVAAMALGVPLALTQTDLPIWSIQTLGTIARAWIITMA